MRVVISGGGTGGHIYPALALIREIKKDHPEATFLYVGTEKGLESKLVRREGIPFQTIKITGFKRKISMDNFKTVARFLKGTFECRRILKKFQPDIVIGTGGYVCGPVVFAATRLKIPTLIHEQNSVPGVTNKFLSKFVTKVAICFEDARAYFPANKVVLTGNPRASEVIGHTCNHRDFGLDKDKKCVLIFGGSRGARPLNDAVLEALPQLQEKSYEVFYVTGEIHYEAVMKAASQIGNPSHVIIRPFVHEMPALLACVDLAVTRAGATTLAELTSLGIPSVLIPSPYVTNNHQEKNARSMGNQGAAHMLLETQLTGETLVKAMDIVQEDQQLTEMSARAKELGIPDAAQQMYKLMVQLIAAHKQS